VKEGEEVTEITPDEDGWTLVRTNKDKGKVPTSYIDWSLVKSPKQPPKPITTTLKATKKPPCRRADQRKGIVQEDFDGDQGDGEIEVKVGEEVTEITPDKDGWTVVKGNGEKGKVPTGFIEWTGPGKGPKQAPARSKKMKKMCAVEDYNAQEDTEVDVYEGEEVTELQPDVEGWTMIRNENGEEGIVPTDYLGISE